MSPDQWQRVCQLVEVVASAPPEAQQQLLREAPEETLVRAEAERLLGRISSAGHFLSRPLAGLPEVRRFEIGTRIADRFVIRRFIGAGGMGEVYEAFDELAREPVALKTLLNVWQRGDDIDTQMTDLFRREVQLSRKVTHANVVRIHDIGEHPGNPPRLFFAMELVAGPTFAQGFRDKLWDRATLAVLLRQVTEGLAAAHRIGVIHRDLKPANVLVRDTTPATSAVTDFGLARALENSGTRHPGSQVSLQQGTPAGHDGAGTPAYMAPECFEGSPATAASDVYALGLIFYEAFTGALPFAHLPMMGALVSRGRSVPKLQGAAAQALTGRWREVTLRCLEPDPSRRFGSALEVLEALDGKFKWSRRAWLGTAAGAAGVALSIPAFRSIQQWVSWKPADESLLLTPPATVAGLDVGWVDVAMRKTLEQSAHLKLWDRGRLPEVMERMGKSRDAVPESSVVWRAVGMREGFRQVAFWTVSPVGEGFSLSVRLEQLNSTSPRFAEENPQATFQAVDRQGLFRAVRDASRWVRERMGESAAEMTGADRLPQDITTNSVEALAAFGRGEEKAKSDRNGAVVDYDEALRLDPDFTMALVRKGDMLSSLSRRFESLRAYKMAEKAGEKRPLSQREALEFRGMYGLDSGDFEASAKAYEEYIKRYPNSPYGYFNREYPLVRLGRLDEAVEMLRTALKCLHPLETARIQTVRAHLAWDYLAQGEFSEAKNQLKEIRNAQPASFVCWFVEGSVLSCAGRWADAANAYSHSAELVEWPVRSELLASKTVALLESGRRAEAISLAEDSAKAVTKLGFRARAAIHTVQQAYLSLSDRQSARKLAIRAASLDQSPEILGHCGTLLARHCRERRLEWLLALLPSDLDLPKYEAASYRIRGEVLAAEHRPLEALRLFQASARLDPRPFGNELLCYGYELAGDVIRAQQEREALTLVSRHYWREFVPSTPAMANINCFTSQRKESTLGKSSRSTTS